MSLHYQRWLCFDGYWLISRFILFFFHFDAMSAPDELHAVVGETVVGETIEKWQPYLWGQDFTLRTDHRAFTTLLATKGIGRAGMRVARWSARLLCYTYDVVYRPESRDLRGTDFWIRSHKFLSRACTFPQKYILSSPALACDIHVLSRSRPHKSNLYRFIFCTSKKFTWNGFVTSPKLHNIPE